MILEALGAVGTLATLIAIYVSAFFVGGRRWKGNYEAEHVRAERQAVLIEEQTAVLAGMSERLARLDEERKEFGGSKTFEATLEVLDELKKMNENLAALLLETKNGNGKEH